MYTRMTPQWASTLLAFLAIAAMPIPFIFFYVSVGYRAQVIGANTVDQCVVRGQDPG